MYDYLRAQLKDPTMSELPTLGILNLEMLPNVSDTELLANLNAWKELKPVALRLSPAHKRVLAIAGSGPSLKRTAPGIPPDCDVMALNGAYKYLVDRGRVPTYFAMLDARACNANFLERPHNDTGAFLVASQTDPSVVRHVPPQKQFVFHLGTPTTRKVFPDAEFYLGGGGTIGLTAFGLAYCLGYRTVIGYGLDSSFEGDARHVQHQPQNANMAAIDVWVNDRKYTTTHAMASQVADFFAFRDALLKIAPEFQIHIIGDGLFYDFVTTNNNPTTRDRELAKYVEAYKHEEYGMSEGRKTALRGIVESIKPAPIGPAGITGASFLDVSTGRGELMQIAREAGFDLVRGTETVSELLSSEIVSAVLPTIPYGDKTFDVVSLIEVIEHLLPEDVTPSLYELTRVAKRHILISAAVTPHWYGGVNLHPSARPEAEWYELFRSVWGDKVTKVQNLGQSPCWLVTL